MNEKLNKVVISGDVVSRVEGGKLIKLGSGLWQSEDKIVATRTGYLRLSSANVYHVEASQKRYIPALNDAVIGVVVDRFVDGWKIDIGCHMPALLMLKSFERAGKRNRPDLPVGALVYTRVVTANKDVEPECACVGPSNKAESFGHLVGGYAFKCSIGLCRQCLKPNCTVLNELGKCFAYEVVVGANGRIWVDSANVQHTISIANCIIKSEFTSPAQIALMVKKAL